MSAIPVVSADAISDLILPKGDTRSLMWPGELESLVWLARRAQPKVIVEFGVNEAYTAWTLLHNVSGIETYVGVDVLPGYRFETKEQDGELPDKPGHLLWGDPRFKLEVRQLGTFDTWTGDFPIADIVLVDADHGERSVLHDTYLARSILNPAGGIVVWHDYYVATPTRLGVNKVLDAEFAKGRNLKRLDKTCLVFEEIP